MSEPLERKVWADPATAKKRIAELEAERDKLREALRWTIEAIDITDWSRDGIEMLDSARQLYLDTREGRWTKAKQERMEADNE